MLASSSATREATSHFSEQVLTNRRYFWRLSKKRKLRCGSSAASPGRDRRRGRLHDGQHAWGRRLKQHTPPRRRALRVASHEGTNSLERVGGDAAAIAQPARQLAVIHGAAAESQFGKSARAAKFADLLENLLVHGDVSSSALTGRCGRANQVSLFSSISKTTSRKVGTVGGQFAHQKVVCFRHIAWNVTPWSRPQAP